MAGSVIAMAQLCAHESAPNGAQMVLDTSLVETTKSLVYVDEIEQYVSRR